MGADDFDDLIRFFCGLDVVDHNVRAFLGEAQSNRLANAPRGPRH